jgi:nicotinate phosphoribosyltransferase
MGRALQETFVSNGTIIHNPTIQDIRNHHQGAMGELSVGDLDINDGSARLNGEAGMA